MDAYHYRLMVPLNKGQLALVKRLEAELREEEAQQRRPNISKEEHAMQGRIIARQQARINNIKYGTCEGEEDPFAHLYAKKV